MPRPPDTTRRTETLIRDAIAAGEYKRGEWLPSRTELGDRYGVSSTTVRQVLANLSAEGLVVLVPGRGARVAGAEPRLARRPGHQMTTRGRFRGFAVAAQDAGLADWDQLLAAEDVTIDGEAADLLHVPRGSAVLCRSRIQGVIIDSRQVPVVLSWTWVHPTVDQQLPILREHSTGDTGMTGRFIEIGYTLHWVETVRARLATTTEAAALWMTPPAAVLDVWRPCLDQNEATLEVTRRVINPDLHELVYP